MTPSKLLIAQRLQECSEEIKSIVTLMDDYLKDPRWSSVAADMARAADLASFWAIDIRTKEK